MKVFMKTILFFIVCAGVLMAFPRPGDQAQNFTIYSYEKKKEVEINVTDKVTVIVSGSVS